MSDENPKTEPRHTGRRGFFAIGIENTKTRQNIGTLWRSATLYGAAFVFTVGARYSVQPGDTPRTPRHTPLFHFRDIEDLVEHLPYECPLVGIELAQTATMLGDFVHPDRACYLLGAEDKGLTDVAFASAHSIVQIESPMAASMNVAVAGSIILHDRYVSRK